MEQGKSIRESLIELGEDPDRLAAYKQDPRGVLAESGLSQEHQQALLSGDVQRVQSALQDEHPDARIFPLPLINRITSVQEALSRCRPGR